MFVYMIKNKISGKSYVGATTRSKLYKRYGMNNWHLRLLSNPEIRNDYTKLGKESFELIVLEEPKSKKELYLKEEFYIKKLNTLFPNGYNFQSGGKSNIKIHDETKRRISETMKKSDKIKRGRNMPSRPCLICNKIIFSYPIRGVLKNTCSKECFSKYQSDRMKRDMMKKRVKVIGKNKITGEEIIFDSIESTRNNGFEPRNVAKSLKRNGSHKGFVWRKFEQASK